MPKFISFLTTLFVLSFSFASTHGGGVFAVGEKEMGYFIKADGENISFAYGKIINGNWDVSIKSLPHYELASEQHQDLKKALVQSAIDKQWVYLQD